MHDGGSFPENSLTAFAAALEIGAGIECDLRLTRDNRIVVFHDPDCWRMCASPIRIGATSLADLGRLRVGDHPIPTLESVLALVAARVPLLLEVKVERDLWRWIPALRDALADYRGHFAVMSFDPRVLRLVKTNLRSVRRGLLVAADLSPARRHIYRWLADPHFLAVELGTIGAAWVGRERSRLPVYGWTVRTATERRQAEVHADALIWEADGRPRN